MNNDTHLDKQDTHLDKQELPTRGRFYPDDMVIQIGMGMVGEDGKPGEHGEEIVFDFPELKECPSVIDYAELMNQYGPEGLYELATNSKKLMDMVYADINVSTLTLKNLNK